MSSRLKILLSCVVIMMVTVAIGIGLVVRTVVRLNRDSRPASEQIQEKFQVEVARAERQSHSEARPNALADYSPLSNLYDLRSRGSDDDHLSSLILQNALIKRDPRLRYEQLDIDRCNAIVCAYVRRGVSENSNYYLRRKLVESFGQSSRAALVNRMRLVAVLLGGEKGSGGMDPAFREIREEAHRFSPYVIVQIQDYIDDLEKKMSRSRIKSDAPDDFKRFVDALSESGDSEYSIARIGSRNRNEPARELYALKVLHRDLSIYYGERVEDTGDGQPYETIFLEPGSFQSVNMDRLRLQHDSMNALDLASGLTVVGVELREYLSALRDSQRSNRRGNDEEVNQIMRLNEIVTVATGLFAGGRDDVPLPKQARMLVDLLFLEGLYSKKARSGLIKELDELGALGSGHEAHTRSFYAFLNYMNGLAYAKMDESLGGAARYYSSITKEADNYLEIQARKSALQVLGLLQLDVYAKFRPILEGERDIHLAGTAQGKLAVFQSQAEIAAYLRQDPLNGGNTIWVLKRGLNMPNEASFAAMILEDPIMKASHYDGYARSRTPPIPLLQVPGAAELYHRYHGRNVRIDASRRPPEVVVTEIAALDPVAQKPAVAEVRLQAPEGTSRIYEINGALSNEEIRGMQKHVGSKAANYAFLRSAMPLNPEENVEHIYPGFAIPYYFYEDHIADNGVDRMIARLSRTTAPDEIRSALEAIQDRIMSSRFDSQLLQLFERQVDDRLRSQHPSDDGYVKLRLRSSSNAEDNEEFSGAGLYESHSTFYTYEDFSGLNRGGIADGIKAVWASLWKPEAYFARQRAGIVQETVRMGVLVHPSYRKEESTGVVFYYAPDDIEIVVNKGKENVQNPRIAGLTPEMHRITGDGHAIEFSSRYCITQKEILTEKDRGKMMTLIEGVIPKFRALYPDQNVPGVDIEFKVMEVPELDGTGKTDIVILKQIRPLAARQ